MRLRAVVLAAGLGTRLRPLTRFLPKPLLPVVGTPVLGHTLAELEAVGCEAVAINLHYQGEKISARYGKRFSDLELVYSPESELLGTLGALAPLETFLEPADLVIVVNGDSLCAWPLRRLLRQHQKRGRAATLLMSSRAEPSDFGGGVALDGAGGVVSFGRSLDVGRPVEGEHEKRQVFAGAHVFSPELTAGRAVQPADFVTDLYQPMLEAGTTIGAVETGRAWHDLGTPRRYLRGVLSWAQHRRRGRRSARPSGRSGGRYWIASDVKLGDGVSVRRSVVESGCVVEDGARIEDSLLLPGARIGHGARVRGAIVGFAVRLPGGTQVERRLVTAARADTTPGPNDSVVGGLVYSRL